MNEQKPSKQRLSLIAATLLYSIFFSHGVTAQGLHPGAIDHTFFGGWGPSALKSLVAALPDGSMLYTRDGKLGKMNPDGRADFSFKTPSGFIESSGLIDNAGRAIFASGERFRATNLVWIEPDGNIIQRIPLPGLESHPTLARQQDGKILIWSSVGVHRLMPTGVVDPGFLCDTQPSDLTFYDHYRRILVQPDGGIILIGGFLEWGNLPRKGIVRLNANGSLDTSYCPGIHLSGPEYVNPHDAALTSDGKLVVVGPFATAFGEVSNHIVTIHPNGDVDRSFQFTNYLATPVRTTVATLPDGKILFGVGSPYGSGPQILMRLSAQGALEKFINDINVVSIWPLPNGNIITSTINLVLEDFTLAPTFFRRTLSGTQTIHDSSTNIWAYVPHPDPILRDPQCSFSRLEEVGDYEPAARGNCGAPPACFQNENLIMVGAAGFFTQYIYRITNGQIDPTFQSHTLPENVTVNTIVAAPDGKLLLGLSARSFTNKCLIRLHPNGKLDTNFLADVRLPVRSIELLPDGDILVAGGVKNLGAVLTIFNDDGSVDTGFGSQAIQTVEFGPETSHQTPGELYQAKQLPSGEIVAVGNVNKYGNESHWGALRFRRNGTFLGGFPIVPYFYFVRAVAVDLEGNILLAYNDVIERFLPDGTRDSRFPAVTVSRPNDTQPPSAFAGKLLIDAKGRIVATGSFEAVNGLEANGIVRLFSKISPPSLTFMSSSNQLRCKIQGTPSGACLVETSDDLSTWHPYTTQYSFPGAAEFQIIPEKSRRFFRAILR